MLCHEAHSCANCGNLLQFENESYVRCGMRWAIATAVMTWSPSIPARITLNSISRSMGQPDVYPFVLLPAVVGKLKFVHDLTTRNGKWIWVPAPSRSRADAN